MLHEIPEFGTDGIRDAAENIASIAHIVGVAGGRYFAPGGGTILLASDPRESSPEIVNRLARGMMDAGADVAILGVTPTPGLAYLTRESNAVAGAMVTASHNPYRDNGIKYFGPDGEKLTDRAQDELTRLMREGTPAPNSRRGSGREDPEAISGYEDFLVASAEGISFRGMRIVIDSANGATSGIAARVFRRLGANVKPVSDKPDGININDGCGATHTEPLRQATRVRSFPRLFPVLRPHMGLAFDGDGDRLEMSDEFGRAVTGDHIVYALAVASQTESDERKRHQGVVVTHMTNLGAENALRAEGIDVLREDVGDRYVLRGLAKTGYTLGGEQSGHIILPSLLATGDGMLAAIQMARAVRASGISLAEWRDRVPLLPQSLVNIPVHDKALLKHPDVVAYVREVTESLNGSGRVLIRPSGTEPKARVMVEAPNAAEAAGRAATGLQALLVRIAT